MEKYDDLDLSILRELRENSKQSVRELANLLGAHPNTVIQRIKRLENNEVIKKYTVEIDYRKIGYDIHALVMIKTKKGKMSDSWELQTVTRIPQIQSLYALTGNYDALAIVRVKERDELVKILRKIQENKVIARTNTYIMLTGYKSPDEFNPLLDTEKDTEKTKK